MRRVAEQAGAGGWKIATGVAVLWLLLPAGCPDLQGGNVPLEELRTAEQIRQLTREQAARQNPVRLRGW